MAATEFLKDKNTYLIKGVSLDNKRGLKATFSNSANTSKGDIYIDGDKYIGTIMLSNGKGEDTAWCDIDTVSGVHDISIKVSGSATISDIEPTDASPYDKVEYIPVPEDKIIDNGHDGWEATDMLGRKVMSVEDVTPW